MTIGFTLRLLREIFRFCFGALYGRSGYFFSRFLRSARRIFFRRDRQGFDAHADRVEDRIIDDCRRWIHVELAQTLGAERARRFIGIGEGVLERRHVAHGRDAIIGEFGLIGLPSSICNPSVSGVANALSQPAFDLAFGADRINHRAAVRRNRKTEDFDLSRLWIDVDLRGLSAVIVSAGLVAEAGAIGQHRIGIETTRANDRRAVVTEQPRARDVGNGYRLAFRALTKILPSRDKRS